MSSYREPTELGYALAETTNPAGAKRYYREPTALDCALADIDADPAIARRRDEILKRYADEARDMSAPVTPNLQLVASTGQSASSRPFLPQTSPLGRICVAAAPDVT